MIKPCFHFIRFWRRLIQFGVLLAFIVIPVLNTREINVLSGNLLAFNMAGLPLGDPLAAAQVALATFSAPATMALGAGLVLLPALLLGPVFCAWICPYGLLSELIHTKQGRTVSGDDKNIVPTSLPFLLKLSFFGLGLLAAFFFGEPLLNQFSMPGWYTRFVQHAVLSHQILWGWPAFFAGVPLLEWIFQKRFWCRCLCPQSVLLNLAGSLLPSRFSVRFQRKACTCPASDRPCLTACSLRLNPRKRSRAQILQCTNCGDCVDACSRRGQALCFRIRS